MDEQEEGLGESRGVEKELKTRIYDFSAYRVPPGFVGIMGRMYASKYF